MNRGDFILTTVRGVLNTIGIFDVAYVQAPKLDKAVKIEAYPYIIKDSLEREMMEDTRMQNQLHFIDIGVIFRWNNPTASNNRGEASKKANEIAALVESALQTYDVVDKYTTDGERVHRLHQINVVETYGYMDTALEVAETAILINAIVETTI